MNHMAPFLCCKPKIWYSSIHTLISLNVILQLCMNLGYESLRLVETHIYILAKPPGRVKKKTVCIFWDWFTVYGCAPHKHGGLGRPHKSAASQSTDCILSDIWAQQNTRSQQSAGKLQGMNGTIWLRSCKSILIQWFTVRRHKGIATPKIWGSARRLGKPRHIQRKTVGCILPEIRAQ